MERSILTKLALQPPYEHATEILHCSDLAHVLRYKHDGNKREQSREIFGDGAIRVRGRESARYHNHA